MREFIATYNGLRVLVHATTLDAARNQAVRTYVDCFAICVRSEVKLTETTHKGWDEVDGVKLPPITWAERDYEAEHAQGEALMTSYRAVGREANAPKRKSIWDRVVSLFADHEVWH